MGINGGIFWVLDSLDFGNECDFRLKYGALFDPRSKTTLISGFKLSVFSINNNEVLYGCFLSQAFVCIFSQRFDNSIYRICLP